MTDSDKSKQLKDEISLLNRQYAELNEKWQSITESILDGVMISDFEGKVLYCNESAVKMFGYSTPAEGMGQNIFKYVAPESMAEARENLARVNGGEWGFLAPYKVVTKEGKAFWIETLGRKITYQGKPAEIIVMRDITERKRLEEAVRKAKEELEMKVLDRTAELKAANEQVERIFKETVTALTSAVEAKDPYTAGHQQRVAKLACAIAREMRLSEDRIDGIYMAAIVHDIGKIHVPAEILTNPKELTDAEMNMVKTHSAFGFEILKSIEFTSPVAKTVHQHHERMDGSGYPQGLKGDEIILEARILAVADVVEAITTDRPYRPARGIDKALAEVAKNKGILYDAKVVDACLAIFKRGFSFE